MSKPLGWCSFPWWERRLRGRWGLSRHRRHPAEHGLARAEHCHAVPCCWICYALLYLSKFTVVHCDLLAFHCRNDRIAPFIVSSRKERSTWHVIPIFWLYFDFQLDNFDRKKKTNFYFGKLDWKQAISRPKVTGYMYVSRVKTSAPRVAHPPSRMSHEGNY